jgi:hypothetical protein
MRRVPTEYSLSEVPELEATKFEFSASGYSHIEDSNGDSYSGASISIAIDALDDISAY